MPYNLPTDNKIDVKHINLRLKEYVEERIRIKDESAKKLTEKNNIEYVENKCTKMEYQKFFLKKRQAFPVLSN